MVGGWLRGARGRTARGRTAVVGESGGFLLQVDLSTQMVYVTTSALLVKHVGSTPVPRGS